MGFCSLPSALVRPVILDYAFAHDGYFALDGQNVLTEREGTFTRGDENDDVYAPLPQGLEAIDDILPSVTMKELEWANEALATCESFLKIPS